MKKLYGIFICVLISLSVITYASSNINRDKPLKPDLSIVHAPTPGYSFLVVIWPDKVVERLLFKDKDINSPAISIWLNQRYDAYEQRIH